MSEPTDLSAETALQDALINALGDDPAIQALLGAPPRIMDAAGARPAFPFVEIARHETRDASAVLVQAHEHVLDLRVLTRWNGRREARTIVSEIRRVINMTDWPQGEWTIVYCHPVYADVLALRDGRSYRGILRLRAMTQRAASES